jgi:hypothetical protein
MRLVRLLGLAAIGSRSAQHGFDTLPHRFGGTGDSGNQSGRAEQAGKHQGGARRDGSS